MFDFVWDDFIKVFGMFDFVKEYMVFSFFNLYLTSFAIGLEYRFRARCTKYNP